VTTHILAGRMVVVLGALLLTASGLFAAAWSFGPPWPSVPAIMVREQAQVHVAHAVLPAAPPALLGDDFEHDAIGDDPPAGWIVDDGRWDGVVDDGGHVVRHAAGRSYGHLVAGSVAWSDYSVSARLRTSALSTGFAGVAARYVDRGDYYACGVYYGSTVRLWRVRGGQTTLLDGRRQDVGADRFHDVRLVVKGSEVSCVFDESVVLVATDTQLPRGRIALVAANDEKAEFDDVTVRN
jgi:hypothetical protein